ncbi:hypothetical protein ES703_75782 [subsurface metagenome]
MKTGRLSCFLACFLLTAVFVTDWPLFAQNPDFQIPLTAFFLYLSPSFFFRTDSHYPAHETTIFHDFKGFYEYENIPMFAEIVWQNYIINFSTYFSFLLRRSFLASGEHSWGTNLSYNFSDIDMNFPLKGYLCWENDFLGFKLARDKIDIGHGYWSSVELNKQNPYWDYFRFFYKGKSFQLTEYIIRLNPTLITQEEQDRQDTKPGYNNIEPDSYQERAKNIVLHEFQFFLGDFLILSVGEFIMIGGKSLQVSDINPMIVFHNFYGEDWGNVCAFLNLKLNLTPSLIFF